MNIKTILVGVVIILLIAVVFVFYSPLEMVEKTKTVSGGTRGGMSLGSNGISQCGQRITFDNSIEIKTVGFSMRRNGEVNGHLYFVIYDGESKEILAEEMIGLASEVKTLHGVSWHYYDMEEPILVQGDVILAIKLDKTSGDGEINVHVSVNNIIDDEYFYWYPGYWAPTQPYDMYYKLTYNEMVTNHAPTYSTPVVTFVQEHKFRLSLKVEDVDGDLLDTRFVFNNAELGENIGIISGNLTEYLVDGVDYGDNSWYVEISDGNDMTVTDIFHFNYNESIDDEPGENPDIPVDPEKQNPTPGFEIMVMIASIIIAILLLRKKK